jgi:hypothetical protein
MQQESPRRPRHGVLHALVLLCTFLPCAADAEPKVYRCAAAAGPASYQDRPCADPRRQRVIEFAPPPAPSPAAQAASPAPRTAALPRKPKRKSAARGGGQREAAMSWECRAANGEVFYRHSSCPATIPGSAAKRRGGPAAASGVRVQATPMPRRDACRRIHASAASARAGRTRDESVTTYERNLGRDPCRRF